MENSTNQMNAYKFKFYASNLTHEGFLQAIVYAHNDIDAEKAFRDKFHELKPYCITISRITD